MHTKITDTDRQAETDKSMPKKDKHCKLSLKIVYYCLKSAELGFLACSKC